MRSVRQFSLALSLVMILALGVPAWAHHRPRVRTFRGGELFCATRPILLGSTFIGTNRCFKLAVLRNRRGAFLAFLEPAVMIPANRVVVLSSGWGFGVQQRIVYLVPLQPAASFYTLVPMNTVQFVPVRVEDRGPRVTFILASPSMPRVIIAFAARGRVDDD